MELEIWNTVIKGTWKNTPKSNTTKIWQFQFHEHAMCSQTDSQDLHPCWSHETKSMKDAA